MAIIPVKNLTTEDILYGDRNTQYRWEVLEHSNGVDYLVGTLDGVSDGSLSWVQNAAVKGRGKMEVIDLEAAQPGMLRIADLALESARIRPVMSINAADQAGQYEGVWEETARNLFTNPSFETSVGSVEIARNMVQAPIPIAASSGWAMAYGSYPGDGWIAANITGVTTAYVFTDGAEEAIVTGDKITLAVTYRVDALGAGTAATHIRATPHIRTGNIYIAGDADATKVKPIQLGVEERVVLHWVADRDIAAGQLDVALTSAIDSGGSFGAAQPGFQWRATKLVIERGHTSGTFYSGDVSNDTDAVPSWTGTVGASPSILTAQRVGPANGTTYPVQSSQWSKTGTKSLRMIPRWATVGSGYLDLMSVGALVRGKTYTALTTVRKTVATPGANRGGIFFTTQDPTASVSQYAATNVGEHELRITFTVPDTGWGYLRLYHGGAIGEPDIWFDNTMIMEGIYTGPFIYPAASPVPYRRTTWLGVADASISIQEVLVQKWVPSGQSLIPEIPWGTFLLEKASEEWEDTGRVWGLSLLDRTTVPSQDVVDQSYAVAAGTNILQEVRAILATCGEYMNIDASVSLATRTGMVWEAGTSKLNIINDLLDAAGYNSLWMDGWGNFQATPRVLPADRSIQYELLTGLTRELVDGERSIYSPEWSRERDSFGVPNKVIAVQAAGGEDDEALVGQWTNEDPASPYSYISRGRWVPWVLDSVDCPEGSDAEIIAFLEARARATLIQMSAVQAEVKITHLPIPVRVGDVLRFANTRAGVDARHVITRLDLDTSPTGLMKSTLQEVISL